MKNLKAHQRDRLIYELGLLLQPIVELAERAAPPSPNDYRVAIAKVQSGDGRWRQSVREFTTFAPDVVFNNEYQEISHVPERLWRQLQPDLEDPNLTSDLARLQQKVKAVVDRSRGTYFGLLERVPVEWEPAVFEANTPFTSYLRIREAVAPAQNRLHYFDRYLKPEFYQLFLAPIPKTVSIRLVTTANAAALVSPVSGLFRQEHPDYQLIEVSRHDLHDRNLRVDDQIFSLGPGVDRVGFALTNFGPADSSPTAHGEFDGLISQGRVVDRS